MKFGSLDYVIRQCEQHLDAAKVRSTEIENYFVQYLLIRICAEYEARVTTLISRRCSRTNDSHLSAFAQKTAISICKRFDIKDIKQILDRFGDDYKQKFDSRVMSGTQTSIAPYAAWNNIYTNRNAVAHHTGTQMSLGDLKDNYKDSLVVLDALVSALDLTQVEIADLV
jgi:tRNA(His) 5'-end guanylyltransferase